MQMDHIIKSLSKKRPVFHSEKDFQFSLAWEIKSQYPKSEIRFEFPCIGVNDYMGMVVFCDNKWYPVEIKYRKAEFSTIINYEQYRLTTDLPKHEDIHTFIKDIQRVETQSKIMNSLRGGFVIWLSNDYAYWEPVSSKSKSAPFFVHEGVTIAGEIKNARHSVKILGTYTVRWRDYSRFNLENGDFKYVLFNIE